MGTDRPCAIQAFMRALLVKLPREDKQTALAEALREMDAELAALERRRVKSRVLKQAMMHEVLNWRTRSIMTHLIAH